MLLSIVVPFFNIKRIFFDRFIESIKNQSNQNYELLLINDGSTNQESLSALYSINLPNVKIYSKQNGGLSSARNYGIDRIKGDLLWIIDPDDCIPNTNAIDIILQTFKENSDLSFLTFGYLEKLPSGRIVDKRKSRKAKAFSGNDAFQLLAIGNGIMSGYTWNKVFNVAKIGKENLGRFDSNLTLYEDKFWQLKLLGKLDKCLYIPDILYQYNYNETSLSHTVSEDRAYSAYTDYILPYISMVKGETSVEYQSAASFIYRRCWLESFNWIKTENADGRQEHLVWLIKLHKYITGCQIRNIPKDIILLKALEPIIRYLIGPKKCKN